MITTVLLCFALAQSIAGSAIVKAQVQAQPTPPTASPADPNNPAAVLDGLTKSAESFQATVREVEQLFKQGATSQQQGTAALDKMLDALKGVESSVSDQGPIWQQYANMLKTWQDSQARAEQKATQDPAFREQADAWSRRVNEASELRASIAVQRNRVRSMISDVEHDRELIVGWYSLGEADKALAGLRKINGQLGELNDGLANLLQQAKKVRGPGA